MLIAAGCSDAAPPSFTPYPIPVDMDAGPVIVNMRTGDDQPIFPATVDTLAPLTIIDSATPGEPAQEPRRRTRDLTLMATGAGVESNARARFTGVSTLDLHACGAPGDTTVADSCKVGVDSATQDIQGMLGADVLSRNAVSFRFRDSLMSFFPDIAGSSEDHGELCEAVFPEPFYGGGTMVIGGTEISFTGRRLSLGTCFFDRAAEQAQGRICPHTGNAQGIDGLFVVSTGLGISLLTETAYARYQLIHPDAGALDTLPEITVYLPSGPITGRRADDLVDFAIVGEASANRGPCGERYANDFLTRCGSCEGRPDECPCGDRQFCQAGSVVELSGPFSVAVVDDSEPIIQALRAELRPDLPELSGIIGVDLMEPLVLDVDYPNNRVVAACVDPATCLVRPAVLNTASLDNTRACLSVGMSVCEEVANGIETCPRSVPQ